MRNYNYQPGGGYRVTFTRDGDPTSDAPVYTRRVAAFDASGQPFVRGATGALVAVGQPRIVWHPSDRDASGPMTATVAARYLARYAKGTP